MKTFLGMPIFPRRKSDAEHIEEIREKLQKYEGQRKWFRAIMFAIALTFVLLAGPAVWRIVNILQGFGNLPGAGIGFIMGAICGAVLHNAVWFVGVIFAEPFQLRHWRLLIQYHDACQALCSEFVEPPASKMSKQSVAEDLSEI